MTCVMTHCIQSSILNIFFYFLQCSVYLDPVFKQCGVLNLQSSLHEAALHPMLSVVYKNVVMYDYSKMSINILTSSSRFFLYWDISSHSRNFGRDQSNKSYKILYKKCSNFPHIFFLHHMWHCSKMCTIQMTVLKLTLHPIPSNFTFILSNDWSVISKWWEQVQSAILMIMYQTTIKTANPKCRLYWCLIVWGRLPS